MSDALFQAFLGFVILAFYLTARTIIAQIQKQNEN